MRLRDLGEFGFIAAVSRLAACDDPDVVVGLGDDCAVIRTHSGDLLAVTTDAMLEGRHFRLDWLTPYEVGARAMTAALSDLAAMGATPRFAFASMGMPAEWEVVTAEELARGLAEQAAAHGACLIGGDTIASHEHALVDVIVIGACGEHIWQRSGARVGDLVAVTGDLGGCATAIAARASGLTDIPCWKRYASPVPRIAVAERLAPLGLVTACLDISDGLVQDAGHICERSGVGTRLDSAALPLSPTTLETAQMIGREALGFALSGGEDFELLLTAPAEAMPELQAAAGVPLTIIGEVTADSGVKVMGPEGPVEVQRGGWDHFAG